LKARATEHDNATDADCTPATKCLADDSSDKSSNTATNLVDGYNGTKKSRTGVLERRLERFIVDDTTKNTVVIADELLLASLSSTHHKAQGCEACNES
jgi:hypothetical protein